MSNPIARTLAIVLLFTIALPASGQDAAAAKKMPVTRNVAIVVHEGVELLDFAGPGEVFAAAASHGSPGAPRFFNVFTVAPGPVVSQGFLTITPQYTIENCPKPDILVVPGGQTNILLDDPKFMAWVKKVTADVDTAMSVCTGAFVLAQTGLLDGGEATTHWGSIDSLRRETPKARVVEGRRFVDNGRVLTTAGVSAGIDGALHLVARLLGRAKAERTAHYMEYLWQPDPEIAKGYSRWNPELDERGQKLQEADEHRQAKHFDDAAKIYEALAAADAEDGESLYLLGLMLHSKGDLDRAIPAHEKAAAFPAVRQRALYNVACAYCLKGEKEKALEALARAIDAGFSNKEWIDGDDDWATLKGDPRFEAIVAKIPAR